MRAVENDDYWDLLNPRTKEVVRSVKARNSSGLFAKWHGRPEIRDDLLDKLNKDNALAHLGAITSTNPCVSGDSLVHTVEGPKPARDLCGRRIDLLLNGKKVSSSDEGFFKTGEKPVFRLETRRLQYKAYRRPPDTKVQRKTRYREDTEWVIAGNSSRATG